MKTGKNFKIIGLRPSRIGDIVTSLPILNLLEKLYPGSYKTVSIAKKCSASVPLFYNHPLIDRLHLNEILEKPNREDYDFFNSHDYIIRPDLRHPEDYWYNNYHMVFENARMMGLEKEWELLNNEERIPRLYPWFSTKKEKRTIVIWPVANSGVDLQRGPSKKWWEDFVESVFQQTNFKVFQAGHPNDFIISIDSKFNDRFIRITNLEFIEQIKISLSTEICINLDSGSGLIMAAYRMKQITLLTNWFIGHKSNFMALEPLNLNNFTFFKEHSCENINKNDVLSKMKEMTNG